MITKAQAEANYTYLVTGAVESGSSPSLVDAAMAEYQEAKGALMEALDELLRFAPSSLTEAAVAGAVAAAERPELAARLREASRELFRLTIPQEKHPGFMRLKN